MNEVTGLKVPKMPLLCEPLKREGVCLELCSLSKLEGMVLIADELFRPLWDRAQCSDRKVAAKKYELCPQDTWAGEPIHCLFLYAVFRERGCGIFMFSWTVILIEHLTSPWGPAREYATPWVEVGVTQFPGSQDERTEQVPMGALSEGNSDSFLTWGDISELLAPGSPYYQTGKPAPSFAVKLNPGSIAQSILSGLSSARSPSTAAGLIQA